MIIALFVNEGKPCAKSLAVGVIEFLEHQQIQVVSGSPTIDLPHLPLLSVIDPQTISYIISLGGDGTILQLMHKHPELLDIPVLGINLGHLGFMADVPLSDLYPSLQALISRDYTVDERIILSAETPNKKMSFALNEVVLHRNTNPHLIEIAIHVEETYVNTFEADGIIIATPNGSTAYSLAAGGPILSPSLDALVVTPISPHTISNRPIVLSADKEIQLQYLSNGEPAEVRADGLESCLLQPGEMVRLSRFTKRFRLISLLRRDYFSTLRSKLGWAGKLRA